MRLVGYRGLGDLSTLNRLQYVDRAGLQPILDSFGSTYTERLQNGYNRARAVLSKYTTTLTYDQTAAEELFHQIETWHDTHSAQIESYMQNPATTELPQQIALALSPETAKQFIVAGFVEAARGLGPWLGGIVATKYQTDPRVTESAMQDDAQNRLVIFAALVKMDSDGTLKQIFFAPGTSGLGNPIAIAGALVWVAIAIIAALALYAISTKNNAQNNALMKSLCDQYPAQCPNIVGQGMKPTIDLGLGQGVNTLAMFAGAGLLLYLGVKFILPAWKEQRA